MVTLADEIYQSKWKPFKAKELEELRAFSEAVGKAQRFVIADDVMAGALSVARKRPSSLLQAWDFVRPPFAQTWVEWNFKAFCRARTGTVEPEDESRPTPDRVGWLISRVGEGKDYEIYAANLAWIQSGMTNISVLMESFCVGSAPEITEEMRRDFERRLSVAIGLKCEAPPKMTAEDARNLMEKNGAIYQGPANDSELQAMADVSNKMTLGVSMHRMYFYTRLLSEYKEGQIAEWQWKQLCDGFVEDVKGEGLYLAALLILLNSKNATQTSEPKTFDALNKKRKRFGKKPILSFSDVDVRIGSPSTAGGQSSEERAAMRRHWVRGHFKVRKTGCFWWSPYARGSIEAGEVRHRQYNVKNGEAA